MRQSVPRLCGGMSQNGGVMHWRTAFLISPASVSRQISAVSTGILWIPVCATPLYRVTGMTKTKRCRAPMMSQRTACQPAPRPLKRSGCVIPAKAGIHNQPGYESAPAPVVSHSNLNEWMPVCATPLYRVTGMTSKKKGGVRQAHPPGFDRLTHRSVWTFVI